MLFCSCHLNLDPMILTYTLDQDVLKMYLYSKNVLSTSRLSKVINRQTDTQTDVTEHAAFTDGKKANLLFFSLPKGCWRSQQYHESQSF